MYNIHHCKSWSLMFLLITLLGRTRVVTKINGHRDQRSSNLSNLNSVNNKIAQPE